MWYSRHESLYSASVVLVIHDIKKTWTLAFSDRYFARNIAAQYASRAVQSCATSLPHTVRVASTARWNSTFTVHNRDIGVHESLPLSLTTLTPHGTHTHMHANAKWPASWNKKQWCPNKTNDQNCFFHNTRNPRGIQNKHQHNKDLLVPKNVSHSFNLLIPLCLAVVCIV